MKLFLIEAIGGASIFGTLIMAYWIAGALL